MGKTYDEFRDEVCNEMGKIDPDRGFDMSMRIITSGVLNDYYDEPSLRTPENAVKMAEHIMAQGRKDDAFMADAISRILGAR